MSDAPIEDKLRTHTTCPNCGSDWVKRIHRKAWEKMIHSQHKKYRCEQCDKSFYASRNTGAT